MSSVQANFLFITAIAVLLLNFASQSAAFPFQAILIIYCVCRKDVKILPIIYVSLLDKSYFGGAADVGSVLKFRFLIPLSVENVFVISVFFATIVDFFRGQFDFRTMAFVPFWALTAIPALYIARLGYVDRVASSWQTPLIMFMIPAFYYWGVRIGRTWAFGRDFVISRFTCIFCCQMVLEILRIYSPGCQFQNCIIPICFAVAVFHLHKSAMLSMIGVVGAMCALAVTFLGGYIDAYQESGRAENIAIVSTFTRLAVLVFGIFLALTAGRSLKGHALKLFPWMALLFCCSVFAYAVIRADTKIQGDVIDYAGIATLSDRFTAKLVADRGNVWLDAIKTELFTPPYIFKRMKDLEYFDPEFGIRNTKMAPHNQFLTLVCRQGWWFGITMVLFLWWMHLRTFMAASVCYDRATLTALLAPSAAIFIAVGLTGQHVFTQMWHASGMASLTFPGVLYGAVVSRQSFLSQARGCNR